MRVHWMPRLPGVAASLAAALLGMGVASSANEPPAVVFKTRPRAVNGVISGRAPLDVTFNMCPTSDPDPGDQLKFTYDFDGDGRIDYYGHCRQTHRYAASNQCVDATVCASDRQPGHRLCRTYSVCTTDGSGGGSGPGPGPKPAPGPSPTPSPTPSPSPSPDILPFTYDLYAFTASPGTKVDVSVDTVSAATAFDPWACLSTTPEGCVLFDENVIDWGDDDQACTFPPPNYECPSFSATLPANAGGVYYLLVSDAAEDDFAGDVGLYALHVGSDAAIGPLILKGNNSPDSQLPPAPAQAQAQPARSRPPAPATPAAGALAPAARPRPARPAAPVHPAEPASPDAEDSHAPPRAQVPRNPPRPEDGTPRAASSAATAIVSGAETRDAGPRPEAVFRTEPPSSARGRITGGPSFDVTFDLCASTSPDPTRELSFSFDFDGDGVVDSSGACRQTRRYEFEDSGPPCVNSVACVGDGRKDHEACRTYTVCRSERPSSAR
jgi:hypothetical protein